LRQEDRAEFTYTQDVLRTSQTVRNFTDGWQPCSPHSHALMHCSRVDEFL